MVFGKSIGKLAAIAGLALVASGCTGALDKGTGNSTQTGDGASNSNGDMRIVTPGKADNFYSDMAKEFELEGTLGVEMTEEEYENETERNKIVSSRLTAVGLYLTTYLTDKIRGVDSNGNGEIDEDEVLFENMDYGGFKAMVRNYSIETEDVSAAENGVYQVQYTIDVAGPKTFLRALTQNGGEQVDGGVRFSLQMPEGATSDPDSVNRGEIRDFTPSEYDGELETVELVASPLPKINNAYPHYDAFLEDGVYDITHFFGYDYTDARSDLQDAREAFETLRSMGFEAPAESFESLGYDSGPFVKTIQTPGASPEEVRVEVRIFHADMFKDERQKQHDLAIERLRESDVFFYNGHAGPYYGLYLDPNHEAEVDYRELAEVELNDKQQIFIAQGCQTYSQYADMLYANPAKSEENLDVITTVNYSYGRGTMALFQNLVSTDGGVHEPTPFYEIVQNVNDDWVNRTRDVFYGVMGIDGNPQVHPYGNVESIGESCNSASDCGAHPNGNVCAEGTCAVRAISEGSCPSGTSFGYLGDDQRVESGICYD